MKGQKSITVNGKQVTLKFDWGAVEDFCEEMDISFSDFQNVIQRPKALRLLVYHMSVSGGSDITKEELRGLGLDQISLIGDLISEAMSESGNPKAPKRGK